MNQYAPTYACPYNVHVVVKHKMTKSEKGDNSVKHVHNLAKYKGAVTYHRIALTDAERTEKVQKMFIRW